MSNNLVEAFQHFVSKDPSRQSILHPFVLDGHLYATDGVICVRTQAPENWSGPSKFPPPEGVKNLSFELIGDPWILEMPDECIGKTDRVKEKLVGETCIECEGFGHVECDLGHEHKCPDCDGLGLTKTKILPGAPAIGFGNLIFNSYYLNLILTHLKKPVFFYHEKLQERVNFSLPPIPFRFDGGEGILMQMLGCKPPQEKPILANAFPVAISV